MRVVQGLRTRIAILVVAGAAVVAVGVGLLLSNTINLRQDANATIRSDRYLVAVLNVERLVVDAETGLRGYVITQRPLFLSPLRAAQEQMPATLAALHTEAVNNHLLLGHASELAVSAQSYVSAYAPSLIKLASHSLKQARSFEETLVGKYRVDAVREQAAMLERLVSARDDARQRQARTTAGHAVTEAIAVLVLLTLLILLLGGTLGGLAVGRELARERSEETTHTLEQSLLPEAIPQIPAFETAVRFMPAGPGELMGGDFYDVFPAGDGRWAVVVGDVCGKGKDAAALTAMARWTLRGLAAEPLTAAATLGALNEVLLREDLRGRFVTVAYLLITPGAETAQVSVACAGHPAPLVIRDGGEAFAVPATGSLLGVWRDVRLDSALVQLAPGDSLVVFTDGVTEQGPESLSSSPEETLRRDGPVTSAEQLAGRVEEYARGIGIEQRDDIAIVALRFKPNGAAIGAESTREPASIT